MRTDFLTLRFLCWMLAGGMVLDAVLAVWVYGRAEMGLGFGGSALAAALIFTRSLR